jgi:hypothetical protein
MMIVEDFGWSHEYPPHPSNRTRIKIKRKFIIGSFLLTNNPYFQTQKPHKHDTGDLMPESLYPKSVVVYFNVADF